MSQKVVSVDFSPIFGYFEKDLAIKQTLPKGNTFYSNIPDPVMWKFFSDLIRKTLFFKDSK